MNRFILAAWLTLIATPAFAVCKTQAFPVPVVPPGGVVGMTKVFTIPANDVVYAVFHYPAGATAVGFISWVHRFPYGLSRGTVELWSLIHTAAGIYQGELFTNEGDAGAGVWHHANLSRPLQVGESYQLGLFNANPFPVTVEVGTTVMVCQ